ncbi:MAG: hypothetical protein KGD74_00025 [Candidatus Lokiarchaeota archaeon]|nr:hypothetical protein [Candidatus Lokiarchaeota archaeon]
MDIIIELLHYIIIIIIGIILVNWYERKKGWDYRFKISLYFILCWRTVIFLILIITNLTLDLFFESFQFHILYPIILVIVTFFINIFLGVKIFTFIYKQNAQESLVIILIIVIIEMILESFLFYTVLIPETLNWW